MSTTTPIELEHLSFRHSNASRFLTEDINPNSPKDVNDIFASSHSADEDILSAIHPLWKRRLFALLEQPTSSQSAFLIHVLSTALIIISAIVTILETVPAFHSISTRVWFGVETSLVALFTVEYVGRCLAWSGSWMGLFRWMSSFFGIIDLLSVLPYYVELLLQQDTSVLFRFSILRMFRLLRVFRPFRYNNTILLTIEVMFLSVRRSQHALLAIAFFVVMVLTVFSTLLYFAERGTWDDVLETFINTDGDPTQFSSIPAAAWFVLVTITTVGYGEITPRSFLGRLVTLPLLVFGLLLITLPSFVLGREFSLVWEKMTHLQQSDQLELDELNNPDSPGESPETPLSPSAKAAAAASSSTYRSRSFPAAHGNGYAQPPPPPQEYRPFLASGLDEDHYRHAQRPSPSPARTQARARDLSNLKLAQNQTELSRQIAELRGAVEMQGRVLAKLTEALGVEIRERNVGRGKGKGKAHGRLGEDGKMKADGDADGESGGETYE